MTPLDPVTARCFPTLARFARRQWWLGMLGVIGILCALSFAGGVVVGSYRGHVADENYHAMVWEFGQFKENYQQHHQKALTTTKAQSAALVERIRREKEQP